MERERERERGRERERERANTSMRSSVKIARTEQICMGVTREV